MSSAAPSVLIIADRGDLAAAAVAHATAARSNDYRVAVVHPDQLALAQWTQTLTPNGRVTTTIELRDGLTIASEALGSVFVGSDTVVAPQFARSAAADRDYAAAELQALMVSWLGSLGRRVVNRCDGTSISGPSWTPRRWLIEAQRAGLRVCSSTAATSARLLTGWRGHPFAARLPLATIGDSGTAETAETAVAVAGRVLNGPLQCGAECERLAASTGCRLFEIEFVGPHADPEVRGVRAPARLIPNAPAVGALSELLVRIAADRGR
jgi:hypothetical protein